MFPFQELVGLAKKVEKILPELQDNVTQALEYLKRIAEAQEANRDYLKELLEEQHKINRLLSGEDQRPAKRSGRAGA